MASKVLLEPDKFFHIYNHANGSDSLFRHRVHYENFLNRYLKYIVPIAETYAYCLLPKHFHLCLKIKDIVSLLDFDESLRGKNEDAVIRFIWLQFSNLFNGYAQWYNKKNERMGNLFKSTFQRIEIKDERYLKHLILYIHKNPVESGFSANPADWKFSSYRSVISGEETWIKKDDVIEWFGGLENFKYMHNHP